jgi:hypothetical protein
MEKKRNIYDPEKRLPELLPKVEKTWERCINSQGEYLEGDKTE